MGKMGKNVEKLDEGVSGFKEEYQISICFIFNCVTLYMFHLIVSKTPWYNVDKLFLGSIQFNLSTSFEWI